MAKIEIDRERCKGCGLCTIACPKALIKIGEEINRQGYFYVVWDADAPSPDNTTPFIAPSAPLRKLGWLVGHA